VRAVQQRGAKDDRDAAQQVGNIFPKQGKRTKLKQLRVVARFPKAR